MVNAVKPEAAAAYSIIICNKMFIMITDIWQVIAIDAIKISYIPQSMRDNRLPVVLKFSCLEIQE
jgi:hypothetical protein